MENMANMLCSSTQTNPGRQYNSDPAALCRDQTRRRIGASFRSLKKENSMASMHDFEMNSITGESVALSDYEGRVCLIVNVASK